MGNAARRVLGILTLGGSFTGVVATLQQIVSTGPSALGLMFSGGFALLYAWGCWCGTRLLEGEARALHTSRIFWALQLPVLVSPGLSYLFSTGSFLAAGVNFYEQKLFLSWQFGSQFKYGIMDGSSPAVGGINLFAAGVVFYLSYRIYLNRLGRNAAPVELPTPPTVATAETV